MGLAPTDQAELQRWIADDPYALRAKALDHELSRWELGRALFHLTQRRGFLSNRKGAAKEDGTIFEGKKGSSIIPINLTQESMEGFRTLGEYLHSISFKPGEASDASRPRLRNRYTLRSMYLTEFEAIWERQQEFHPELGPDIKRELGDPEKGILFFQRPLRSQKSLIGKCTFERGRAKDPVLDKWVESGKPRCPISHPDFERFRTWQFINSLRAGGEKLSHTDRTTLFEEFLRKDGELTIKDLAKKLKHLSDKKFNYEDNDKRPGCKTIARLSGLMGQQAWDAGGPEKQHELWHAFFSIQNEEQLEKYILGKGGLSSLRWKEFCYPKKTKKDDGKPQRKRTLQLEDGYANLSLKAIRNILPFLEEGYEYDHAVMMGGIRNAFGAKAWDALSDEQQKDLKDACFRFRKEVPDRETGEIRKPQEGEVIRELRDYLRTSYKLSHKAVGKLYHHSQHQRASGTAAELPQVPNLRNPIVQKALGQARKVVGELVKRYGRPAQINVELAREIKVSAKVREKMELENRDREKLNAEARKVVREYGLAPSRENIQKYLLFKEIDRKSEGSIVTPYSMDGKAINLDKLFSRDSSIQIEHIVPRSVSLDDSLANKTLCEANINRAKGNKTPFEFYTSIGADWKSIQKRAFQLLPYPKAKRFVSETKLGLDDFISRQLNDTRYISKAAAAFLKEICPKVQVSSGGVTARLRKIWGLEAILGGNILLEEPWNEAEEGEYLAWVSQGKVLELIAVDDPDYKKKNEQFLKQGAALRGYVKNQRFIPEKNRDDHRHHAVDAIAVACVKPQHVQLLAKISSHDDSSQPKPEFKALDPWEGFFHQAKERVQKILVSHEIRDKVFQKDRKKVRKDGKVILSEGVSARGQLHLESVYGKRSVFGEEAFHLRKPLESITKAAQVNKIVDPAIRRVVEQAILRAHPAIKLDDKYDVPKDAFFATDPKTGAKRPKVFLRSQNGIDIPILKVRIKENLGNARPVNPKATQWVNPKNNHHAAIYKGTDDKLIDEVVSFWDATQRMRDGKPAILKVKPDGSRLVAAFQANEMFLLGVPDREIEQVLESPVLLAKHLYRVQKMSDSYYVFRLHKAATIENDSEMVRIQSMKAWQEHNPVKLRMDVLGKLVRD